MKAVLNGTTVAEADKDELIYIEGRWYFPPSKVRQDLLRKSDTPYNCPWKGDCQYFDIGQGDAWAHDDAWSYPTPLPRAIEIVNKDFGNYIAFWRDVEIRE